LHSPPWKCALWIRQSIPGEVMGCRHPHVQPNLLMVLLRPFFFTLKILLRKDINSGHAA
jgi:hypothetical protein